MEVANKKLIARNQAQLALQILDVLIQAEPENIEGRRLRIDILRNPGHRIIA